jgi:hypothetical protein
MGERRKVYRWERDHWEDQEVDGLIIFRWILERYDRGF